MYRLARGSKIRHPTRVYPWIESFQIACHERWDSCRFSMIRGHQRPWLENPHASPLHLSRAAVLDARNDMIDPCLRNKLEWRRVVHIVTNQMAVTSENLGAPRLGVTPTTRPLTAFFLLWLFALPTSHARDQRRNGIPLIHPSPIAAEYMSPDCCSTATQMR